MWLTIVGLVKAGLGVSLVPFSFRKLGWGKVQYRPLQKVRAKSSVALCYKSGSVSPQGERFIELVSEMSAGK